MTHSRVITGIDRVITSNSRWPHWWHSFGARAQLMDGNGEPLVDAFMVMEIIPSMVMQNLAISQLLT